MICLFSYRWLGACLLIGYPLCSVAFDIKVTGLEGALKENVNAQLTSIETTPSTHPRVYRAQVDDAVRTALQALGHFEPEITYQWKKLKDKDSLLVANVKPGPAVVLTATTVKVLGEGKEDRPFVWLLKHQPKTGLALNQGQYEDYKAALEALSAKRGYFDAHFVKKQLGVNVREKKAYWDLIFDTGERYRFGSLTFQGNQIDTEILNNLVPFHQGDFYDTDGIAELNQRLSETRWFNSVLVTPDLTLARQNPDNEVPIQALVTPRKGNLVETGLGYATNVGPRGKISWIKPWLNSRGHSMEVGAEVSQFEQSFDTTYKLPLAKNALEHYYLFQGGFKRTDINDTESDSSTMMASRYWDPHDGWLRAIHLTWKLDNFTQGQNSQQTMLLYPGITVSKTRSRGGLMPRWGDSQRYTLQWSDDSWGSDANFVAMEMQHTLIRSYENRHRFIWRSHLGWISTSDFNEVPPDLRYFAGGDRSLRGYDYESISPRDKNGDLKGGSKLLTASLEYQFKVTGKWWGAAFFDVGDVVDHVQDFRLKKGVGLGIRWESPLGPIKLDIARPVGSDATKQWQFYIGLGPEL